MEVHYSQDWDQDEVLTECGLRLSIWADGVRISDDVRDVTCEECLGKPEAEPQAGFAPIPI